MKVLVEGQYERKVYYSRYTSFHVCRTLLSSCEPELKEVWFSVFMKSQYCVFSSYAGDATDRLAPLSS